MAFAKAGKSIEARIAIMAITTSNSISVKPVLCDWDFVTVITFNALDAG